MLELLSLLILGAAVAADQQVPEPDAGPLALPPLDRDLQVRTKAAWEGAGVPVGPWTNYQANTWLLLGRLVCPDGHGSPWVGLVQVPPYGEAITPQTEWSRGSQPTFEIASIGMCAHESHGPEHLHFEAPLSLQNQLWAAAKISGPRLVFLLVWNRRNVDNGAVQIEQAADPAEVVERLKQINHDEPDANSESELEGLKRWAETARPGDVIDGHWNVWWVVAMRPDAKNADGDQAQFTYDWPYLG